MTVIQKQDHAALIEWQAEDGLHRSIVPPDSLQDLNGRTASIEDPERGIPYGLPWAELWTPSLTPEALEAALHQVGLWTGDDLRRRPNAALGALQAAYGLDLSGLLLRADQYEHQSPD